MEDWKKERGLGNRPYLLANARILLENGKVLKGIYHSVSRETDAADV